MNNLQDLAPYIDNLDDLKLITLKEYIKALEKYRLKPKMYLKPTINTEERVAFNGPDN